jgi:hypothetical protein
MRAPTAPHVTGEVLHVATRAPSCACSTASRRQVVPKPFASRADDPAESHSAGLIVQSACGVLIDRDRSTIAVARLVQVVSRTLKMPCTKGSVVRPPTRGSL